MPQLHTLTPAVQAWLARCLAQEPVANGEPLAQVHSAYARACNLVDRGSTLISLQTGTRGLAPFGALVRGEQIFAGLRPGQPVEVGPGWLRLGGLVIDWDAPEAWDPVPDWDAVRQALAREPGQVERIARLARADAPAGSLLGLAGPDDSPLLRRARPAARRLLAGLQAGDAGMALAGAHGLAGLGGGTTPAGDDFLVGALFAGWAGLIGSGWAALAGPLAAAAAARTTALSGAYLRSAARGECAADWHALWSALPGDDEAAVAAAVRRLARVGHTSGADALAGFLLASDRRLRQSGA